MRRARGPLIPRRFNETGVSGWEVSIIFIRRKGNDFFEERGSHEKAP